MRTKKKAKRFDIDAWRDAYWKDVDQRAGSYSLAIANPEIALQFSLFVTAFTHLEVWMDQIASLILGTDENTTAHIMGAIVSAKARIELMRRCLERARRNSGRPHSFDEIVLKLESLNGFRNKIVHARYMTKQDTDEVLWQPRGSDPLLLDMAAYEPFEAGKLEAARREIVELTIAISRTMAFERESMSVTESTNP